MNEENIWFIRCEIDDESVLNEFMCNDEYNEFIKKV